MKCFEMSTPSEMFFLLDVNVQYLHKANEERFPWLALVVVTQHIAVVTKHQFALGTANLALVLIIKYFDVRKPHWLE